MPAAYLSSDRPELLFPVKELTRGFADPKSREVAVLKRIARYLKRAPKLVQSFPWQRMPTKIEVYSDSDFAGDKRSRKSTTGVCIMFGSHCITTRCKQQSVIALSSGEAELYAGVLACSMGIGLRQMYEDFGIEVKVHVLMDSTAGISMMKRVGLGTVKHVATAYLWVQEKVASGEIELPKVDTLSNLADLMTKGLAEQPMRFLLGRMGFYDPAS